MVGSFKNAGKVTKCLYGDILSVNIEMQELTLMLKMINAALTLQRDKRGQDMIEYALLAASIAVVVAGFLPPAVMPAISTIFSKVISGFNAS